MQTPLASRTAALGDTMLAASRQMWLAGLGAAGVTRHWANHEAGHAFRALVREGTVVEARARRFVEARVGTSVNQAGTVLRNARTVLRSAARTYASAANTLVRHTLPAAQPVLDLVAKLRPASTLPAPRAASKRRAAAVRSAKPAAALKRTRKPAAKPAAKPASKRASAR